mgnify:CR=1 FL=1
MTRCAEGLLGPHSGALPGKVRMLKKCQSTKVFHPGEFLILQKSFLHCGESSSERLPLPPVSSPLPRKAWVRKRGAPRPSQTRRCQPTTVHPRMRGGRRWGMQTHELDLFNAPCIAPWLPVHCNNLSAPSRWPIFLIFSSVQCQLNSTALT